MSWFTRVKEGITTKTRDKKETPDGLWYGCPACKKPTVKLDHIKNSYVCPHCNFHERIGSAEYFNIFFDDNQFTEFATDIYPTDSLNFIDNKKYIDRIVDSQKKTGFSDSIRTAYGKLNAQNIVIACMDFSFIGGSMGAVVGEKVARAIDCSIERKDPLLIISKSGGARMMEAAYSLMQMAKTAAKLTQLSANKIPFISLITDPTTGGVTASFAMLGDINIAEPGALIGFAGPRVIRETIGKDLPKGFQSAEFLLENGFMDLIVDRRELKNKISDLLFLFAN